MRFAVLQGALDGCIRKARKTSLWYSLLGTAKRVIYRLLVR